MGIRMICMCNLAEGFHNHADLGRPTVVVALDSEGILILCRFSTLSTSCSVRYSSNAAISSTLERGSHVRLPIPHVPGMGYYFADLVFPFRIITKVIENLGCSSQKY